MNIAKNVLFTMVLCGALSANAKADEDLKLGLNARSYPFGAQVVGTTGFSSALWGDTTGWKYGYLRGAVNAATSAVINRAGLEFQFFPISILGFSAGYDWAYRSYTPHFLDCGVYDCRGRVDRAFLKSNFVVGAKGFLFLLNARYESLHSYQSSKPFFDEMTLMVGKADGERMMTWNPILLYVLDPNWKIGATSLYTHALDTGDYSSLTGPVASYSWDKIYNILGGIGLNRSPVVHSALGAFLVFQYTLAPSLSLQDSQARN